jgi:phosphoglycerol transferase MdoB-like AlkP superfamily enzyme
LVENGYTALAFHGNRGGFYSRDEAYPKMGFNEFKGINKLGLTSDGWGDPDNKSYKEEKTVASFLDISPTILKLSGVKYNLFSDGVNLIDIERENKKIPFKEKLYDAKELFNDINKKIKVVPKK